MKRALLPTLLLGSLVLSACGGVEGTQSTPAGPANSGTPAVTQPVSDQPKTEPQPPPPPVESKPPAPVETKPPAPAEQPIIKWYSPGIGLPLKSDDPAAQGKKVAMLTFDDGPHPKHTDTVLAALKRENVKALFFVTGYGAKNRDVLERIYRDGHTIGVHTMTHPNMTKLSAEQMRQEIEPLIAIIEQVTGQKPKYFRPPFGAYNDELRKLLKEYNMELVNWTNGSLDWEGTDADGHKDPNKVVADVMKQLHPGANILMHDIHRHTGEALPELIQQIRAEGYEFVVLN